MQAARYPAISQDLSRPAVAPLMSLTAALGHGDWVQLINPPDQLTPGPIDQLVWGWTETLNAFKWEFTFNMVPELPYATGPQVINLNTDFADGSLYGWSGYNGTIAISSSPPDGCPTPFAVLYTPNGTTSSGAAESGANHTSFAVTAGGQYLVNATVYAVDGTSQVEMGLDWLDHTAAYLSTSTVLTPAVLGEWVMLQNVFTAPAGAVSAVVRVGRDYPGFAVADFDTLYATNLECIYPATIW